jgi:hypothetical protein
MESSHIKNLVAKSLEAKSFSFLLPGQVEPRMGIQGAAIDVIDSFIDVVVTTLQEKTYSGFKAQYMFYTDAGETVFVINDEPVDYIPILPIGDFFEAVPDLLVMISATTDEVPSLPRGMSDAIYAHDPSDIDDIGEINVHISLPDDKDEIIEYFKTSRLELCGILTHEMQHVVQKMVCGYTLPSDMQQDFMAHAFDVYEIDARVEETIMLMGDDADETNSDLFFESLNSCIDQYLKRNSTTSETQEIKERMIGDHVLVYKNKIHNSLWET